MITASKRRDAFARDALLADSRRGRYLGHPLHQTLRLMGVFHAVLSAALAIVFCCSIVGDIHAVIAKCDQNLASLRKTGKNIDPVGPPQAAGTKQVGDEVSR